MSEPHGGVVGQFPRPAAAVNSITGSSLNVELANSASPGPRCPMRATASSRAPAVLGDNARTLARLPSQASAQRGGSLRKSVASAPVSALIRLLSVSTPNPETLDPALVRAGATAATPVSISHSRVRIQP